MTTTKNTRDFSQAKIYKIEPICEFDEGDIYIGSTTQNLLSKRMRNHRSGYNRWKKGKTRSITSYTLFDKYGIDNCKILLIENVNASNYDELVGREAFYIRTLKCVNKFIPLRTQAEWRQDNNEKHKQYHQTYREKNKEKIDNYHKEYFQKNKEKIDEYKTQYREEHKDEMKEYQHEYHENNKEKVNQQHREYYEANKEAIFEKRKQRRLQKVQEKLDRLNNTVVVNL